MSHADAIIGARRTVAGAEAAEAFENQFQISRIVAEINAGKASSGLIGCDHDDPDQCVRFSQCEAKTIAESRKPMITLTIAPALNARKGLLPAAANSRTRVVKPILRKQKMKAQVRRSLIGATSVGTTVALNWPRL